MTAKEENNYLDNLDYYVNNLDSIRLSDLIENPNKAAIISVDMINGFCRVGSLASERNAALIPHIVRLFQRAWEYGIRNFVLLQDAHHPDSSEFEAFAGHAIAGTEEAQPVTEIADLPFFPEMQIIEKNSLHPAHGTRFDPWLHEHASINHFIVVGNCTDLCVYQTAMHLRTTANAAEIERRVSVPVNCIDTYDLPIELAAKLNAQPHPADLLGKIFIHHMALNKIDFYKAIE